MNPRNSKICESKYLATEGLTGHPLRNTNLMNESLRRVREQASKSAAIKSPESRRQHDIALLIVETRVLTLKLTIDAFSTLSRMHKRAVQNAETPGSHPQHESMSRIYRTWTRKNVPEKVRERLLDLLLPELDEHGRPWRNTVEGLYRRWMYQAGQKAFQAASKKAKNNRPLTYGTLWQRHIAGVVPDFEEVRIIAKSLGSREQASENIRVAEKIWAEQKAKQLIERGVSPLLVQLLISLQLKTDGLWINEDSLVKKLHVKHGTAESLANGRCPPLESVEPLIRAVIAKKEQPTFLREWKRIEQEHQQRESFATAFERIRDNNGWNNQLISSLLGILPPEKRQANGVANGGASHRGKKRVVPKRREVYRPSAELRRMYRENVYSAQAPAKAVIELVARDVPDRNGSVSQKEYLTSLFLDGVSQRLRLQGSALEHSELRKHRVLFGTSAEQLASVCEYSRDEILLIEQGRIQIPAKAEAALIDKAVRFPLEKVKRAKRELERLESAPSTVQESVTLLVKRMGGYVPVARMLGDDDDPTLRFSCSTLKQIERGTKVPALPQLRRMIALGGLPVGDAMIRDWYREMPEYLLSHSQLNWTNPLVRGVGIVVFEQAANLHDFWERHCCEDFTYSVMTRNFKQMNLKTNFGWPTISRYLNAAGLGFDDPRRIYLQYLFSQQPRMVLAAKRRRKKEQHQILQDVLKQWRASVRKSSRRIDDFDYRLGLTEQERQS